jgi:hypothetical protein
MTCIPEAWPEWQYIAISTLLILAFALLIYWRELRKKA